jgi:protocatechuate 3,4-dioxygenase beta subunit
VNKRKISIKVNKNSMNSSQFSENATHEIEEGPYYLPNSPERTILFEEGIPGEKLILTGFVFNFSGKPIAHVWLDFWQANGRGEYDISGYTLRGHQFTDKSGKYVLETVVPRGYANRTPHIHVKLRANEGGPVMTTQLFIPRIASNETDFLYRDDLLVDMEDTPNGKAATFNFKLKT